MGRGTDVVLGAANVLLAAASLGTSVFETFVWLHVSEAKFDVCEMKLALVRGVTSEVESYVLIPLPSISANWDSSIDLSELVLNCAFVVATGKSSQPLDSVACASGCFVSSAGLIRDDVGKPCTSVQELQVV